MVGLTYVCRALATRNRRDDPTVRGIAAAGLLLGALVALGNVVFVFAGTLDGVDADTYNGRQVLELELALTGSYLLFGGLSFVAVRLLRRRSDG